MTDTMEWRDCKVMTDEDYIRAGVELAEGFDIFSEGLYINHIGYCTVEEPLSWILDALTAQLVRQVDAVRSKSGYLLCVWQKPKSTTILDGEKLVCQAAGDRREMNTIKTIVDSGVLSVKEDG